MTDAGKISVRISADITAIACLAAMVAVLVYAPAHPHYAMFCAIAAAVL